MSLTKIDFSARVLQQLIRDNDGKFSVDVARKLGARLPGFDALQLTDVVKNNPQASDFIFEDWTKRLFDACGHPDGWGPPPDLATVYTMLDQVGDGPRAKWLAILKRLFPWIMPDFDLAAWREQEAAGKRATEAFFDQLTVLTGADLEAFVDAVIAEAENGDRLGLFDGRSLAARVGDLCERFGLRRPPDNVNTSMMLTSFAREMGC